MRLLADHREDLVAERTRMFNRLRWHLHELDPDWDPAPRSLTRPQNLAAVAARLAGMDGLVARLAAELAARISALTTGSMRWSGRSPCWSASSHRRCWRCPAWPS